MLAPRTILWRWARFGCVALAASMIALAGCSSSTAGADGSSHGTSRGIDRATRIKHGIQSIDDVKDGLAAPCDADSQYFLRGLGYFRAVGRDSYPGHPELVQRIVGCADERTAAGKALSAVELTRGAMTLDPKEDAIAAAHQRARQAAAIPFIERADADRRAGATSAELYDLSLARFVWPEIPDAGARIEALATELERASRFTVLVDFTADAGAISLSRDLRATLAARIHEPLLQIADARGVQPQTNEGMRLTVQLSRHGVSRSAAGCFVDRPNATRVGGTVTVALRGSKIEGGSSLDLPPARDVRVNADCADGLETVEEVREQLHERIADHVAAIVIVAYEGRRTGRLQTAMESVSAGRSDAAVHEYVLFALHHKAGPPSTTERYALEKAILESRGIDGKALAQLHGSWDSFRPFPIPRSQ